MKKITFILGLIIYITILSGPALAKQEIIVEDFAVEDFELEDLQEMENQIELLEKEMSDTGFKFFEEAYKETIMSKAMGYAFTQIDEEGFGENFNSGEVSAETAKEILKWALSDFTGMSPYEIAQMQAKNQLEEVEEKIFEIKTSKEKILDIKEILNKIEIVEAEYYWKEEPFVTLRVDFTVVNKTDTAIARLYCNGVVRSPDREIPWVEESFNYSIAGGIEPGETRNFEIRPPMSWREQDTRGRDDLVLELEVVNFEGPDKEKFVSYELKQLMEQDLKVKLENLQQQKNKLQQSLKDIKSRL